MNAETLTALKGSIAKWEAIVAGTGKDEGPDNCPLCKMFFPESDKSDYKEYDEETDCLNCPVRIKSGHPYCRNTPYITFAFSDRAEYHSTKSAQAELDFLKSLLPDESSGGLNAKPTSEATDSFQ